MIKIRSAEDKIARIRLRPRLGKLRFSVGKKRKPQRTQRCAEDPMNLIGASLETSFPAIIAGLFFHRRPAVAEGSEDACRRIFASVLQCRKTESWELTPTR